MNARLLSGLTVLASVVLFAPLVPTIEPAPTPRLFMESLEVRERARDDVKRARERLRFYAKPGSPKMLWCQTVAFRWANDQLIADYDQAMEQLIAAARTPQPHPAGPRHVLSQAFLPPFAKVSRAYATETAELEALRVSLLLQESPHAP